MKFIDIPEKERKAIHEDKELFTDVIARAAEHPSQGGLGVRPQ